MDLFGRLFKASRPATPSKADLPELGDPTTDKTNPRKRIHAKVNTLEHGLNLTLPSQPTKAVGVPGFAIFSDPDGSVAKAAKAFKAKLPDSFDFRVWYNDHDKEDAVTAVDPGRYISVRGNAAVVNRLKNNNLGGNAFLVHASKNVGDTE
jgi:hypothetical protein